MKEIRPGADAQGRLALLAWQREAELLKRLEHPALPGIVDILQEEETLYIVMDFIEGRALSRVLREEGAQTCEKVIDWGLQLCNALEYLHTLQPPVIYRDMKPSNIMLCPDGRIKLIDFGISREYKKNSASDTVILGTDGYAAPEQHGSGQTDPRSDIYSLGVTLREMFTGLSPELYRQMAVKAAEMESGRNRRRKNRRDEGLELIIQRCTAFLPEKRYPSVSALREDLLDPLRLTADGKRMQRRRLAVRIGIGLLAALLTGGMFWGIRVRQIRDREVYQQLLDPALQESEEKALENCRIAMELHGEDPRAYFRFLEICAAKGSLTEREEEVLLTLWKQNREKIPEQQRSVLTGEIGKAFFYFYSGGDNSFRTRTLKAEPFFREGGKDMAEYEQLCSFCIHFVFSPEEFREPDAAEYRELPAAIRRCLEDAEMFQGEDADYRRLLTYRETADLLNMERQGLAWSGVPMEEIMSILDRIEEEVQQLRITQKRTTALRDELMELLLEYRDNLRRTYYNTEKIVKGDQYE